MVIGLPDCGNVCKTKHLPGFVERMQELVDAGFPSVVVASVTTPEKLQRFLEEAGAVACGIKGLADTSGGFTRMLGLEINNPGTTPPYSQRYVAFVQDGTLVRLVRIPSAQCFGTCTSSPRTACAVRFLNTALLDRSWGWFVQPGAHCDVLGPCTRTSDLCGALASTLSSSLQRARAVHRERPS